MSDDAGKIEKSNDLPPPEVTAVGAISVSPHLPTQHPNRRHYLKVIVELGTLVGIWTAAFVAIWAIHESSSDAKAQRDVMQNQLAEMEAGRRPWVVMTVEPLGVGFLGGSEPFANVSMKITAKNIGSSPASNVWATEWIWLERTDGEWPSEEKNLGRWCDRFDYAGNGAVGRTLFPSQSAELPAGANAFYSADPATVWSDTKTKYIRMWVLGCVRYQYGNPLQTHFTPFSYILNQLYEKPSRFNNPSFTLGRNVDASHLRLEPAAMLQPPPPN